MGQAALGTDTSEAVDDGIGVLRQLVVHGKPVARTGTVVIDGETTADIGRVDRCAQGAQLGIEARSFGNAARNIAQIADLRTHVEMQQTQPVQAIMLAQAFDNIEHLLRRKAELGPIAAGVLPVAGAGGRQPQTHADQRFDTELGGGTYDQINLGGLFDHDVHA